MICFSLLAGVLAVSFWVGSWWFDPSAKNKKAIQKTVELLVRAYPEVKLALREESGGVYVVSGGV